jgi:hypothetical protein
MMWSMASGLTLAQAMLVRISNAAPVSRVTVVD